MKTQKMQYVRYNPHVSYIHGEVARMFEGWEDVVFILSSVYPDVEIVEIRVIEVAQWN
jgi:hypothetical protein